MGVLAGVSAVVYGFVFVTVSAGIPLLFCYEAEKSNDVVVAYKSARF